MRGALRPLGRASRVCPGGLSESQPGDRGAWVGWRLAPVFPGPPSLRGSCGRSLRPGPHRLWGFGGTEGFSPRTHPLPQTAGCGLLSVLRDGLHPSPTFHAVAEFPPPAPFCSLRCCGSLSLESSYCRLRGTGGGGKSYTHLQEDRIPCVRSSYLVNNLHQDGFLFLELDFKHDRERGRNHVLFFVSGGLAPSLEYGGRSGIVCRWTRPGR